MGWASDRYDEEEIKNPVKAPSSKPSQEELEIILSKVRLDELRRGRRAKDSNFTNDDALSAINSLTLKQVKELIDNAKTASTLGGVHMIATYELIQSAERIWS